MEIKREISGELLEELRVILREEYGLEPSDERVREIATNILHFYRTVERLSNHLS